MKFLSKKVLGFMFLFCFLSLNGNSGVFAKDNAVSLTADETNVLVRYLAKITDGTLNKDKVAVSYVAKDGRSKFVCYKTLEKVKISSEVLASRRIPSQGAIPETYLRECVTVLGNEFVVGQMGMYDVKSNAILTQSKYYEGFISHVAQKRVDVSKLDKNLFVHRPGSGQPFIAVVSLGCPHCLSFLKSIEDEDYNVFLAIVGHQDFLVKLYCKNPEERINAISVLGKDGDVERAKQVLESSPCPPDKYSSSFNAVLALEKMLHTELDILSVPFFIFEDGSVMSGYSESGLKERVKTAKQSKKQEENR